MKAVLKMSEILNTMVEVMFENDDDFLKIRETLTRIGIASRRDNKLFQSCHILHKRGRYFILQILILQSAKEIPE